MSKPQSVCVYCEQPGRTKEHIWGRWSKKYIPHNATHTVHTTRIFRPDGIQVFDFGAMNRPGDLRSQTIKAPCRPCNMGWMREVNEAAEPILVSLGKGMWWPLSETEKTSLGTWVTMFSMTYEYADRKTQATTQEERKFLMSERRPPENWKVWIAEFGGGEWDSILHHKGLKIIFDEDDAPSIPPMNTQATTFTFGKLLIHAVSTRANFNFEAGEYGFRLGLQAIWPINGSVIRKPFRPHMDLEVEFVAQAFELAFDDIVT